MAWFTDVYINQKRMCIPLRFLFNQLHVISGAPHGSATRTSNGAIVPLRRELIGIGFWYPFVSHNPGGFLALKRWRVEGIHARLFVWIRTLAKKYASQGDKYFDTFWSDPCFIKDTMYCYEHLQWLWLGCFVSYFSKNYHEPWDSVLWKGTSFSQLPCLSSSLSFSWVDPLAYCWRCLPGTASNDRCREALLRALKLQHQRRHRPLHPGQPLQLQAMGWQICASWSSGEFQACKAKGDLFEGQIRPRAYCNVTIPLFRLTFWGPNTKLGLLSLHDRDLAKWTLKERQNQRIRGCCKSREENSHNQWFRNGRYLSCWSHFNPAPPGMYYELFQKPCCLFFAKD